jgi:hypothetical protein
VARAVAASSALPVLLSPASLRNHPAPRLPEPPRVRGCMVEVDFEALADAAGRQHFLDLPTTFALPRKDVAGLIAVGRRLREDSPDFQRLLRTFSGAPRADGEHDPNCA